jgi:DNA-binding MarR family transcriptional regulator
VPERHHDQVTDDSVGVMIDQAADFLFRYLSDRTELGASAAFVLNRLRQEGPTRLTTLAAREGVSQPSMTQLVQRLEKRGLVAKVADPEDGRVVMIGITDTGLELTAERLAARRDRLRRMLTVLNDEERDALTLASRVALPLLQRLVTKADTYPGCADAPGDDDGRGER